MTCNYCGSNREEAKVVVGKGNPTADIMIIGEAPGAKENEDETPFVGRSGILLNQLLLDSGIRIEDLYICNVIKCRPPNNRKPSKREIEMALPWLIQQIKLVDPKIILLIGATALKAILEKKDGIKTLRGTWHNWNKRLVMPLFHPAYLLRNPSKAKGAPLDLTKGDLIKIHNQLTKPETDQNMRIL